MKTKTPKSQARGILVLRKITEKGEEFNRIV
jgi:hypothetical protein